MKKIIIALTLTTLSLNAAIWSKTMMSIATGELPPFVSTKMTDLTTKVTTINAEYSGKIKEQVLLKNTETLAIRNLEKEILFELKKINFNQKYLNQITATK